jgi:hypothetical protein
VAVVVSDALDEDGERRLRFEHGGRRIEVRVSAAGERRDLDGA